MKKFLIISILSIFGILFAISPQQDEKNQIYLNNLDKNVAQSIQLIEEFNNAAQKNFETFKGVPAFTNMLMGYTLELAHIRRQISDAQTSSLLEKEKKIGDIIKILDPNIQIVVINKTEQKMKNYLDSVEIDLTKKITYLRKFIIEEEAKIVKSKTLNKTFFSFHTHHFLYSLLLDYIADYHHLSQENKKILYQTIQHIHSRLMKEVDALFNEYQEENSKE
ncbi:MAG: hypothetical protein U9N34_01990 [Candidatus Cloacimonadota bacterium]|nr:hypothetical protein [Candidatus Cloacimonadota bacterium]